MERIDTALLLVRVFFGISLFWHGYNKIRSGMTGTAAWFSSIGMARPRAQARAAAAVEILGGLSFAAGLLTPLAAASLIATMIVAIVTVHWKIGFFIFLPGGGWEYCASIAVLAAAVSLAGPGTYSIDRTLGLLEGPSFGVAGIALGVLAATAHLALTWKRPEGTR